MSLKDIIALVSGNSFEEEYAKAEEAERQASGNYFDKNVKDVSQEARTVKRIPKHDTELLRDIVERIVSELYGQTEGFVIENGVCRPLYIRAITEKRPPVTIEEIRKLPVTLRPQLTGELQANDLSSSSGEDLLMEYMRYMQEADQKKKRYYYGRFRVGMDILDIDPVVYELLGRNRNSISHWLPYIAEAATKHGFFMIPDTTVVRVPPSLLQLTRKSYNTLTLTTLKIVDEWAIRVFGLDVNREYFIKTGIFSSKFDFRNAHVKGEKEVRELGEYLLFIQNYATSLAYFMNAKGGISGFYGVATTNEFVVRDYIRDKESNPCIYNGMPLHTEYRVFIEFDGQGGYEILGISPYWRKDVMISRFSQGPDRDTAKMKHDLAVYLAHEKTLYDRYEKNKDLVLKRVREMAPDVRLAGQWSLDIMQNGDDFYIIDMAEAASSALIDCVPKEKIKKTEERWITSDQLAAFSAQEHKKD